LPAGSLFVASWRRFVLTEGLAPHVCISVLIHFHMYEIGVGTNGTVFPEFDGAVTSLADRQRNLFVTVVAKKDDILLHHFASLLAESVGWR